jgi:ParB-like nuclease domain
MDTIANTKPRAATVLTPTGLRRGSRWQQAFVPVKNEPGELLRIDKSRLHIDRSYQRKLWPNRITRIAANWSWVSCGALIVSHRGDGHYFIIDGQHRWEAAKLVKYITDLPCLCFELDRVHDEAIGFLAANTERKYPSLAEQFKALMIAQDPVALIAQRLAESCGRRISAPAGADTISCVAEFFRLIQFNPEATERAFPVVARVCNGHAMTARLLRGLVILERRMPAGSSLNDARWRQRLDSVGYTDLLTTIRHSIMLEGNGSERACAEGILRAINRGLRQPLVVDWPRTR